MSCRSSFGSPQPSSCLQDRFVLTPGDNSFIPFQGSFSPCWAMWSRVSPYQQCHNSCGTRALWHLLSLQIPALRLSFHFSEQSRQLLTCRDGWQIPACSRLKVWLQKNLFDFVVCHFRFAGQELLLTNLLSFHSELVSWFCFVFFSLEKQNQAPFRTTHLF